MELEKNPETLALIHCHSTCKTYPQQLQCNRISLGPEHTA